jgi:hypothetical protein
MQNSPKNVEESFKNFGEYFAAAETTLKQAFIKFGFALERAAKCLLTSLTV